MPHSFQSLPVRNALLASALSLTVRKHKIAPYIDKQLAQMDQATRNRLYELFPERSGDFWTYVLIGFLIFLIATVAGAGVPAATLTGLVGTVIATIVSERYLKRKDALHLHLERLSRIPFEVHGYLEELVRYDDRRRELIETGDALAVHVTIRFTQPVAGEAIDSAALREIPNGAEVRVHDAGTLLYIQHKLMIVGERWHDPRLGNDPLKAIAGAVSTYYRRDWPRDGTGPLAEFPKRQPLQRWFMQLIVAELEPLHEEYPIREVKLELKQ